MRQSRLHSGRLRPHGCHALGVKESRDSQHSSVKDKRKRDETSSPKQPISPKTKKRNHTNETYYTPEARNLERKKRLTICLRAQRKE